STREEGERVESSNQSALIILSFTGSTIGSNYSMKYLDLTLPTAAENLACDEALLDWCEEEQGMETLRVWEAREYFVVLGYANKAEIEVNVKACRARRIPIFRRCSGGGVGPQRARWPEQSPVLMTEPGEA